MLFIKQKSKKYFSGFFTLLLILEFFLLPISNSHAAVEREARTFYVSAYYSPLPDQSFYLTGNYEKEKILNGEGIRGASGKNVYEGMLAAPQHYAFGTKIELSGMGIGTVDDRGGAIVPAGQRGHSYDRLDIWMGFGEDGLKRALSFGKQTVSGYVYAPKSNIKNTINVEAFKIINKKWPTSVYEYSMFTKNFGKGEQGEHVAKLQEALKSLGYLKENFTPKKYDQETLQAVFSFQKENGIVKTLNDSGAGYFGPSTRKKIESLLLMAQKQKTSPKSTATEKPQIQIQESMSDFPVNLGKESKDEKNITQLQKSLFDLGYKVSINGKYDEKTIQAVLAFQLKAKIIQNENETGAGYFGNKTRQVFMESLKEKEAISAEVSQVSENQSLYTLLSDSKNVQYKQKNEDVRIVQTVLQEFGFFDGAATGYFGDQTKEAVIGFQTKYNLLEKMPVKEHGMLNEQTREKLLEILELYEIQKISEELEKGASGQEVQKLQNMLRELGYLETEPTGNFGNQTQEAVLEFQRDVGVIKNSSEKGAGRVGPSTIKKLNERIMSQLTAFLTV